MHRILAFRIKPFYKQFDEAQFDVMGRHEHICPPYQKHLLHVGSSNLVMHLERPVMLLAVKCSVAAIPQAQIAHELKPTVKTH